MKRSVLVALLASTVFGACTNKVNTAKGSQVFRKDEVVDNQFLVMGEKEKLAKFFGEKGIAAEVQDIRPQEHMYKVVYQGDQDYDGLLKELKATFEIAEPNRRLDLLNKRMQPELWPTNKYFLKQWALNNVGQSAPFGLPGTRGADMDILKAWETTKGSKKIVVAVIDTGVDYTHPNVKKNMWVNELEAKGQPGVDDDGNGYTDDIYGYDFVSGLNEEGRTKMWYGKPGDPDPMDDNGHGTFCASEIGGISEDGEGVIGVNQDVQLMALRFLGEGGGQTDDAINAIYYAIDKKVDIMSNSWGGGGKDEFLAKAIADAQKAGILFVAAAGNDGSNNDVEPSYPASYTKDHKDQVLTNVISVGASDNQDAPASFSNFGHKTVHVFAPGVDIFGAVPVAMMAGKPPYAVFSGTSMAAPYVSGVAALMMAANPSLRGNPAEVKRILIETSDLSETLVGKAQSNGRINAAKALAQQASPQPVQQWARKAVGIDQKGYNAELFDVRHEIKVDGAKAVRLLFTDVRINEPYDSVYIYDGNLRLITNIQESKTPEYWSPVVPGDTVIVRFVNSKVQKMNSMPIMSRNESECANRGAINMSRSGDNYACSVDSNERSSSGGATVFNTFNSAGFRIDAAEYLTK